MPGETGTKSPTPQLETPTKKKAASSSGKAALAKVSLLDGSTLDVTIDVSLGNCWLICKVWLINLYVFF